jgi:predicted nucleic acid-binding protein
MVYLDTNVFLRFLTRDDEEKAQACFELFKQIEQGDMEALISEAILAEVVYVLSSRTLYGLRPQEIGARLKPLARLAGLKMPHKRVYVEALDIYAAYSSISRTR